MKKRLLSGIKPSGIIHIGNYFGAIKQFVDLQEAYDSFIFIADLHAITTVQNREELSKNILNITMDYLACGLDPKKVCLFKQSDLPEVTELTWYFNCLTTMPYLERATAYKDAKAKSKEANVGLFDYPILMAADILIQDADIVPVGSDQKQHVEYARDTAIKFNNAFGETFKLPEPLILKEVAIVPGIDGRKMSKSYGNTIPLFSTREEIQKLVMSIVTDSGSDVPTHVYNIHKLLRTEEELAPIYEMHKGKYKPLKEALIEDLDAFIKPMRERREKLAKDMKKVLNVVEKGNKNANKVAAKRINEIKKLCGLSA